MLCVNLKSSCYTSSIGSLKEVDPFIFTAATYLATTKNTQEVVKPLDEFFSSPENAEFTKAKAQTVLSYTKELDNNQVK